jgi:predicted CoA-binding protein
MDPNSSTDPAAKTTAAATEAQGVAAQASSSASKKTLVLGASENPSRYSFLAANRLLQHGHPVVLIGARPGQVAGQSILTNHPALEGIHTVTLYLNPLHQAEYEDYIVGLKPARVIFNPGTENPDFMDRLEAAGVEVLEACTLVMLGADLF